MTISIFVSYSHQDEAYRVQLEKHLAPLRSESDIEFWFDGKIAPGEDLDKEIRRAFKRSPIFVALGSHNYLHSTYCFHKEYIPALNRARRKTMRVVVALVGTCDWKNTRMANYKLLPRDGKPVDQWRNRNQAFLDIVEGLRAVVAAVRKEHRDKAAAGSQMPVTKKRKPRRKQAPASKSGSAPANGRKASSSKAKPASGTTTGKLLKLGAARPKRPPVKERTRSPASSRLKSY